MQTIFTVAEKVTQIWTNLCMTLKAMHSIHSISAWHNICEFREPLGLFFTSIKPGVDKDMALLAYFKKSNLSKAVLPSPNRPLIANATLLHRSGQQMCGRRAGENKRLNVRVSHNINQMRNV